MLTAIMGFIGVFLGMFLSDFLDRLCYKKTGHRNCLGVFILICRKSKHFKWLGMDVWGNDDWFYDRLEVEINTYKNNINII